MTVSPRVLIVEARFYDDIADAMLEGAVAALDEAGARYDRISVPGALEIPPAIVLAAEAGARDVRFRYDAYVALGCVIRGETTHYDIVSNESARGIMDLGIRLGLSIGNGIITVENDDQAWARARKTDLDKGGGAAKAALALVALKRKFGLGA